MSLGGFVPIERTEWVPEQHQHHLLNTGRSRAEGDSISGRRLLMWNDDVEIWFCRPTELGDGYYRNGEGDEVLFVHEGSGASSRSSATCPIARAITSSSRGAALIASSAKVSIGC